MSPVGILIIIFVLGMILFATWKSPRVAGVMIWSLITVTLLCSALLLTLPGPFQDTAIWITLAVPLLWMAFQLLCYWDAHKWRALLTLCLISLTSGVIVFLSDPKI